MLRYISFKNPFKFIINSFVCNIFKFISLNVRKIFNHKKSRDKKYSCMHAELIRNEKFYARKKAREQQKILYYCTLNMILHRMYMRILLVIFCLECGSVFFLLQISFSTFFTHKKAVFSCSSLKMCVL